MEAVAPMPVGAAPLTGRDLAGLSTQLVRMERTLRLAREALAGPDPEAALGYLAELHGRVQAALGNP